jgi:hypothetical protein
MVWTSVDGVWRVEVRDRGGRLQFRIEQHGGLRRSGDLIAAQAFDELNGVLAELGARRRWNRWSSASGRPG